MRIVAGRWKGRRLAAPADAATRPTSEKVREAVFSMLGSIDGRVVLDLFAGTGALGLEALSRGALRATMVESRRPALASIRENIATVGAGGAAEILARSVERSRSALLDTFDLVFADPPWALVDDGTVARVLGETLASPVTEEGATLVLEHASRTKPPVIVGFAEADTRRYGDTAVTFYQRVNSSPADTSSSIEPGGGPLPE